MKDEDAVAAARGKFGFSRGGASEQYCIPIVMVSAVGGNVVGFELG